MRLTSKTYHSREMNMKYMSASQFKAFSKCEAAALAELRGEYVRPETEALLVGSYVDAFFEKKLSAFAQARPEIFKRDGNLKAPYVQAGTIIQRTGRDRLFHLMLSGRKQVIKTGKIAGVPFKVKIDSLLIEKKVRRVVEEFPDTKEFLGFADGAIVDLKVMRDMRPVWSDEDCQKVSFVEGWGYDLQGAIYQEIEGHKLPFFLAVVTKEQEADMRILSIGQSDLDVKLAEVEEFAPKYQRIKLGELPPTRCEHCDYCRSTRRLTSIMDYRELEAY